MNVSVLLYVPVRSGSLAAIDCLKVTGTDSLEVGADHVLIMPRPCNGVARANVPLTRRPGAVVLGSATLSVADPSPTNTGKLVNGTFVLTSPLGGLGTLKTWTAPTSNESVPITFTQSIAANEPLRTGTYSKTLTFTLSTTTP